MEKVEKAKKPEGYIKGYQYDNLVSAVNQMKETLDRIEKNTAGVVTYSAMEDYVTKQIAHYDAKSKNNLTKAVIALAGAVLSAIVAAIATIVGLL